MDNLSHNLVIGAGAALSVSLLFKYLVFSRGSRSRFPRPPGPKGYPIFGNVAEIRTKVTPWIPYSKLSKEYGGMVYLESLGTKILVITSYEKAVDILDKRSSKHSGRPYLTMVCGEMGMDAYFSFMNYGPMWKRQRRAFHQELNQSAVPQYHPVISEEVAHFVDDLSKSPEKFRRHIRRFFDRVIFKTFYGVKIKDEDDPFVVNGCITMEGFLRAGIPGTFLVDIIPALKYLPKWMPWTGWKNVADYYRGASDKARQEPYDHILKSMNEGACETSVATRLIERLPLEGDPTRQEEESVARDALAAGYIAGADTSDSTATAFVLLMALYPEMQKRAQAELDEVVGVGQFPTVEDRPKLVYLQALTREVLRWQAIGPLGLPHMTTEDDIYDGYFIPKGTIVQANIWHMFHSDDYFDNPGVFNPDRYIKDGEIVKLVVDPLTVAFGFGRRTCPGRYMALDTLFSLFTAILVSFDISPLKDESGKSTLEGTFSTQGVFRSPDPFDCNISPRSRASK